MASKLTVVNKSFTVMTDHALTSIDRNVLTELYGPLVGFLAISIYQALANQVEGDGFESQVLNHSYLLKILNISAVSFVEERTKLEGIGLLQTYYKDNLYVYVLKNVLSPYEFFKNEELRWLLEVNVRSEDIERLKYRFLLRKLDVNKFEDITTPFDEAFSVEEEIHSPVDYGVSTTNNGIMIRGEYLDLDAFLVAMESLEYVKKEIYNSTYFIEKINRYAFLYRFTINDLKTLVLMAADENKNLDYDKLKLSAKLLYEQLGRKGKITVRHEAVEEDDKVANTFNKIRPDDIVYSKTKTHLTSAEVNMFDELLLETQVTIGVLNVCINYVLVEKNNKIMPYNYYLKILNDWKRANIATSKQALDYINHSQITVSTPKRKTPVKKTPEWYQSYKENNKVVVNKEEDVEDISVNELEKFFEPKK